MQPTLRTPDAAAEPQPAAVPTPELVAEPAPTPELAAELAPKPTKESTMSRNPNAIAALASSQAALAVMAIVSKYLGAHLGPFWSQEVIAGATVVVLYVGRSGIKGALGMVMRTLKSIWTGPSS